MHPRRRPLAGGLTALVTVAAMMTIGGQAPAWSATPATPSAAAAPAIPDGRSADPQRSVTLVTGDRVVVSPRAGGMYESSVRPGAGRERIGFQVERDGTRLTVLPSDAAELVAGGRLDARLFDVTGLIEAGYDDARSRDLPLILTYPATKKSTAKSAAKKSAAARTVVPPGARAARALPSVNGAAVSMVKTDGVAFWRALAGGAAGVAAGRAPDLGAGVAKVWLDGKARLSDDRSNAQIGVPAAWQAGFNGTGVTVAVLDSGYDATHPDLRDAVVESKDFTGSAEGVKDPIGHGTHVASIVAGSGTASAGKYAGVAPGAKLAIGRVCGDESCAESAIIAGMEWAAPRARVVNLSLGTEFGTDGTDPIAQAVNQLSADTGALFVASAGNSFSSYAVGSPASADAALAVGSVDADDVTSGFSSQGPRVGDNAVKPDISAPGEGIIAARAAGTEIGDPVDERYITGTGTSMSSPHVAGAAAILAQAHPDWKADRLKAVLMSTAAAAPELGAFAQGAGRVDVGRAVKQLVYAGGSVSFPLVPYPAPAEPVVRAVTYHNAGDAPVNLALSLSTQDTDGAPLPAGALRIGAAAVVVPARGRVDVPVTVNPAALGGTGGELSGRIVATGPDGIRVQTAIGVVAERPTFDVEVKLIDRDGRPASGALEHTVVLYNHTRVLGDDVEGEVVDGVAKMRVRPGTYDLFTRTLTAKPGGTEEPASTTIQVTLALDITGSQSMTLDARQGRKIDVTVADRRDTARRAMVTSLRLLDGRVGRFEVAQADMFAVPLKAPDAAALKFAVHSTLGPKNPAAPDFQYNVAIPTLGQIPVNPSYRVRTRDLAPVLVNFRAQGKPTRALHARNPQFTEDPSWSGFGVFFDINLPSARPEFFSTGGGQSWSAVIAAQRPRDAQVSSFDGFINLMGKDYRRGRLQLEDWNKSVLGPSLANSPNYSNAAFRFGTSLATSIPLFSPSTTDQTNNLAQSDQFTTGSTTLTRDGTVLERSSSAGSVFASGLPAEAATYELSTTGTRNSEWSDRSSRVDASWTFRSESANFVVLPLLFVHVGGRFDALNAAPRGRFQLDLTVDRQAGSTSTATIKSATLESSVDDGATWKPLPVSGAGSRWCASITNPRSGYVSLRASVLDSAGDSHRTTIIHAYKIKP